jgi:hypothetical protein
VAPGPTSGEVANPWWGQHLFSRAVFLELCILVFEAGVRFYLWTRGDPGLVRDAVAREASVDSPHAPQSGSRGGCRAVGVVEVKAIMTPFPEPP